LRLLLVKIFPVFSGSSVRSRQQYYNYGSGNELKNMDKSNASRAMKNSVSSEVQSPMSPDFAHNNGITVKTSYTVERLHSDTDEASLVSHGGDKKV
jgi:hypothetical protein